MNTWDRVRIGLASTVLATSSLGGVIIVDSHGGGQFTNMQMAVNNAQAGDTLLVKNGGYSTFTIDGKPLTVAVEDGATATVYGSVVVKNLAVGEVVVLSGLTVTGATTTSIQDAPGTGLIATGNSGALRAIRCRFQGAQGYGVTTTGSFPDDCCYLENHGAGWHGAIVDGNTGGVAFEDCHLEGGRAGNTNLMCYCGDGEPGGDALRVSGGLAAVYDCALVGGRGGNNGYSGGHGGAACRAVTPGTGITTSGSSFQAGDGGDGYDYASSVGGVGGDGLVLQDATAAHLVESTFAGGQGGLACGDLFPPGPDGVAMSGTGTPYDFGVPKLVLDVSTTTVREQEIVPVAVTGRPGDIVYMTVGPRTPYRATAMWKGVMLAHSALPPHLSSIVGTIPASGVLDATWTVPSLGESVDASNFFLQVWRNSPTDGRTLGSFVPVTVLDSSF